MKLFIKCYNILLLNYNILYVKYVFFKVGLKIVIFETFIWNISVLMYYGVKYLSV